MRCELAGGSLTASSPGPPVGHWCLVMEILDEGKKIHWSMTLSTQLCSIIICSKLGALPRATTIVGSVVLV
jgi:hypothetical protein